MRGLNRCLAAFSLVAAVLCTWIVIPAVARADGDPASDYLPTVDIFVPLEPAASPNVQKDLDNLVFAAKRKGYVVKVAVIGSRTDLGAVPQLFGKPQIYAKFLANELRFTYSGRLLIVMPQGVGIRHASKAETTALHGLKIAGTSSDDLVRDGMRAVRAGAEAVGLTLPILEPTPVGETSPATTLPEVHSAAPPAPVSTASSSSSSTTTIILIAAGAGCLILTAAGALFARWKGRDAAPDPGSSSL